MYYTIYENWIKQKDFTWRAAVSSISLLKYITTKQSPKYARAIE